MRSADTKEIYTSRQTCRICGEGALEDIIRFPDIPIADSLLSEGELGLPEIRLPLTFVVCTGCYHAQIREDVSPEILFNKNYPYYTGVSASLSHHFITSAQNLIRRFELSPSQKVLEIASNDGTMLQIFDQFGCGTLGVDPASGPCSVATSRGLHVLNTFFTNELSQRIDTLFGKADLILGNNVLAHVPDPGDLVAGIANLLAIDGHVVIEVPHLLTLLINAEFDTIFHQHYSYFSIHAAERLFLEHGLYLNDVEQVSIHGGSIRLFFSRKESESDRLGILKKIEMDAGMNQIATYHDFAGKVNQIITTLQDTMAILKKEGKTIVGYGAAGKANTLINVAGLGTKELGYIADISRYKQGMYFTGAHLLIVPPEQIVQDMPDYVLILAWNFKDEIIQQLSEYQKRGGRFIIPIPEVTII